jgi:ribonuclease HII
MTTLKLFHDPANRWEIGIDEVGRGPLCGRLYVAGVILHAGTTISSSFHYEWIKDSKKFTKPKPKANAQTIVDDGANNAQPIIVDEENAKAKTTMPKSKKRRPGADIEEVASHIREQAYAFTVAHAEATLIDQINIRQAVLRLMRQCAQTLIQRIVEMDPTCNVARDVFLLIDGDDFPLMTFFDDKTEEMVGIRHETVEKGDNTYASIAAASILAKVSRDQYVEELCLKNEDLDRKYGLRQNKGYGTKRHIDGIKEHGIVEGLHRESYGICKVARRFPM